MINSNEIHETVNFEDAFFCCYHSSHVLCISKEQLHIYKYTIWPLVACIFLSVALILPWFFYLHHSIQGRNVADYIAILTFDHSSWEILKFYIYLYIYLLFVNLNLCVCVCVCVGKNSCCNNSTLGGAVTQEEMRDSNPIRWTKTALTFLACSVIEQKSCIHCIFFVLYSKWKCRFKMLPALAIKKGWCM